MNALFFRSRTSTLRIQHAKQTLRKAGRERKAMSKNRRVLNTPQHPITPVLDLFSRWARTVRERNRDVVPIRHTDCENVILVIVGS